MKCEPASELSRALDGARAEFTEFDRIAVELGRETAVRSRLNSKALVQPNGKDGRRGLSPCLG